jgi:hypothetical protein
MKILNRWKMMESSYVSQGIDPDAEGIRSSERFRIRNTGRLIVSSMQVSAEIARYAL